MYILNVYILSVYLLNVYILSVYIVSVYILSVYIFSVYILSVYISTVYILSLYILTVYIVIHNCFNLRHVDQLLLDPVCCSLQPEKDGQCCSIGRLPGGQDGRLVGG